MSKIFGKAMPSPWPFQRDTNHCDMLRTGPCQPSPAQHYSAPTKGKESVWIWWENNRYCSYSNICNTHYSYSKPCDRLLQPQRLAQVPNPDDEHCSWTRNQPLPVSVCPIHKNKYWKQKSTHLEKEETLPLKEEVTRQTTPEQDHQENMRKKMQDS